MRAAYYCGLAAYGPVPLPRIVERWTVPRASFVFKKSQENFERKTLRRLVQIKDGHPETVELWLAFLRKHQYYGVGMKANVWSYEKLGTLLALYNSWAFCQVWEWEANAIVDVGKNMDLQLSNMKEAVDEKLKLLTLKGGKDATAEKVMELINKEDFNAASGTRAPMTKVKPEVLMHPKLRALYEADQEADARGQDALED